MRICVLGAGITGLATAYVLQQRGHDVTVVDRAPTAGAGASAGNGAQLSYAYVQPLADPSIWRQLPKLLLAPDSPLKLRPALDPQQWRWLIAFMAACNSATSQATTRQLLALAAESRAGFEAMRADLNPDCDFSATGKLVLYRSAASFDGARRQLALQRELGAEQYALSKNEALAIEPALAHDTGTIAGAIHTPGECAADCLRVCEALAAAITARGARLVLGASVSAPRHFRGGVLHALDTSAGAIEADAFICAFGAASRAFVRGFGARLPLYPLKGYSLTLGAPEDAPLPQVSVTDSARKIVFARLGERLRVAGIAEIAGHDLSIPPSRVDALRQGTLAVFPALARAPELQQWSGLRPATPTGRPIVGAWPKLPSNLLLNTGHGALGFTLAFGTAARIAQQLEQR